MNSLLLLMISTVLAQELKHMNVKQLVEHFNAGNIPSESELLSLKPNVLSEAIKNSFFPHRPDSTQIPRNFLKVIPPNQMKLFTSKFWEAFQYDSLEPIVLTSLQFKNLPSDAFKNANAGVLEFMEIEVLSETDRSDKNVGKIVENIGTNGCISPLGVLKFIAPKMTKYLQKSCIESMSPQKTFPFFNTSIHLNSFSFKAVKSMTAEMVSNIPSTAFDESTVKFIQNLDSAANKIFQQEDPDDFGCAGLSFEQLKNLKSATFSKFSYHCTSFWAQNIFSKLTLNQLRHLQDEVFSMLTNGGENGERILEILPKISASQLYSLGSGIEVDEEHPCFEVKIKWSQIGIESGDGESVRKKITPKCLSLLDPQSLKSMSNHNFSPMSDDVLSLVSAEGLSYIPSDSIGTLKKSQLKTIKPESFSLLRASQFEALVSRDISKDLSEEQLSFIPFQFLVSSFKTTKYSDQILKGVKEEDFVEDSWIKYDGNLLSVKQWNGLGCSCAQIKWENIELAEGNSNFWLGINFNCLNTLESFNKITKKEAVLINDFAIAKLRGSKRDKLKTILGEKFNQKMYECQDLTASDLNTWLDVHIGLIDTECFSKIPPKELSKISKEKISHLNPVVMKGIKADQVSSLTTTQIESLTSEHLQNFSDTGLECSYIKSDQINHFDLTSLSKECIGFITPKSIKSLKVRLPAEALQVSITGPQFQALSPEIIESFDHQELKSFGAKFHYSDKLHPCSGANKNKLSKLNDETKDAIGLACKHFKIQTKNKYWIKIILATGSSIVSIALILLIAILIRKRKKKEILVSHK